MAVLASETHFTYTKTRKESGYTTGTTVWFNDGAVYIISRYQGRYLCALRFFKNSTDIFGFQKWTLLPVIARSPCKCQLCCQVENKNKLFISLNSNFSKAVSDIPEVYSKRSRTRFDRHDITDDFCLHCRKVVNEV